MSLIFIAERILIVRFVLDLVSTKIEENGSTSDSGVIKRCVDLVFLIIRSKMRSFLGSFRTTRFKDGVNIFENRLTKSSKNRESQSKL